MAGLGGGNMTARNNPTPEGVRSMHTPEPKLEVIKCASIRRMTTGGNYINLTADVVLADEAAAAIAKLTAERDAWRLSAETLKSQIQMDRAEHEAVFKIAEAAEKRVKELEAKLKRITAIGEDNLEKLKSYIDATPAIEAANKLLSERVAVLEKERDTLADQAQQFMDVSREYLSDTDYDANGLLAEADAALHVTLYDLRRALAAREAK